MFHEWFSNGGFSGWLVNIPMDGVLHLGDLVGPPKMERLGETDGFFIQFR